MDKKNEKAVSIASKRAWDEKVISEWGVGSQSLMEAAGVQLAQQIAARLGERECIVLCGSGNNGGDGYVLARWLHCWGSQVSCFNVAGDNAVASQDNRWAFATAIAAGVLCTTGLPDTSALSATVLIVDAILGSGITRAVSNMSTIGEAVRWTRQFRPDDVIAIDVPTGMLFDSSAADSQGEQSLTVQAGLTLVLGAYAPEHWVQPWKQNCGEQVLVSLGFERFMQSDSEAWTINKTDVRIPLNSLRRDHKGKVKRVVLFAGREGFEGAGTLVARGAIRAGATLIHNISSDPARCVDSEGLAEVMYAGCRNAAEAAEWLTGQSWCEEIVLIAGPGLGRDKEAARWLELALQLIARRAGSRLVLDADALQCVQLEQLVAIGKQTVLTPHPGEAATLLKTSVAEIQQNRLGAVKQMAALSGCTVLLKGSDPILVGAASKHERHLFSGNNPALATGGSGDVLSGVIAAWLARRADQELSVVEATRFAVWLHQQAGALLGQKSESGWRATDIADAILAVGSPEFATAVPGSEYSR